MAPYIYRRPNMGDSAASAIPRTEALQGVRVLARPDGIYVFELTIDPTAGFDPADLDELAYVVAMVTKGELGHTHYHHNMPGKGRATALKPSQILYVPPVQVASRGWATRFRNSRLADADAAAALAIGGNCVETCAILELRHRYIRVEDTLNFRIRRHRDTQGKRQQGLVGWGAYFLYGLIAAGAIFSLTLPPIREVGFRDFIALVLTSVLIAFGLRFRSRIATWDVPVIRLLRTGHGFFTSAEPLNQVAEGILRAGNPRTHIASFSTLLANLESRIGGEQHRIGMGQNWLALTLGAASLVAALSALKHSDKPEPAKPPPLAAPGAQATLAHPVAAPVPPAPTPAPAAVAPSKGSTALPGPRAGIQDASPEPTATTGGSGSSLSTATAATKLPDGETAKATETAPPK